MKLEDRLPPAGSQSRPVATAAGLHGQDRLCNDPNVASMRVRDLKVILDRLAEQAESSAEPTAEDQILRAEAIAAFIVGRPELLDEATPFLWEYYRYTAAEFTPEQRVRYGIPEIPDSADIWEHVEFRNIPEWRVGGGPLSPGRSYLSFEGEVSWEPEHGLQLVCEDGRRVCKVSEYDGHVTVAHAYGDQSLLGVIYG
jgi:hypothetical protein